MDRHALMRGFRMQGVDQIRTWSKSAKPPQASRGLLHAWIYFIRARTSYREGKHDLPNAGCAIVRVLRQELVQKSGTAPRHAGDEHGPLHKRSIEGLLLHVPRVCQPQSSFKQAIEGWKTLAKKPQNRIEAVRPRFKSLV